MDHRFDSPQQSDRSQTRAEHADSYRARLAAEKNIFQHCVDVDGLPDVFHYWSNRYVQPKLEPFGFGSPHGMFRKYLKDALDLPGQRAKRFASLGAGNCDLEVELALHLRSAGSTDFIIDCLDVNQEMLKRGQVAAEKHGVAAQLNFVQVDLNQWEPDAEYDVIVAN